MKASIKNKVEGSNPHASTIPADLAELFANAPQLTAEATRDLAKAAKALDRDPAFLADYQKGIVVEDILRALQETKIAKNELAKRIGKSRQYVGRILDEDTRVNFTIDTLAEIAVGLQRQLCIRILPESHRMHVLRTVSVTVEPMNEDFTKEFSHSSTDEYVDSPSVIPFPSAKTYELSRLRA